MKPIHSPIAIRMGSVGFDEPYGSSGTARASRPVWVPAGGLARRSDDGGLGKRYPGEQVRANRLANQTFANRLRTVPERSRVHPFAFARLRMTVSETLCWRLIQARAISQIAFEAWGRP